MEKLVLFLTENLYNYMIPVCLLCLFRILVCALQTSRTYKLRKKLKFHSVRAFYAEIGCWIGIFIGGVLACCLPKVWFIGMILAVILGVAGFKVGKKKGIAEDNYWREEGKRLIAEAKERGDYEDGKEVKTHGAAAIIQAIGDDHREHHHHEDAAEDAEVPVIPATADTIEENEE